MKLPSIKTRLSSRKHPHQVEARRSELNAFIYLSSTPPQRKLSISSSSESASFNIHQLSFLQRPFNAALYLLAANSLAILLISVYFYLIEKQPNLNHTNSKTAEAGSSLAEPILVGLLISVVQLTVTILVIVRLGCKNSDLQHELNTSSLEQLDDGSSLAATKRSSLPLGKSTLSQTTGTTSTKTRTSVVSQSNGNEQVAAARSQLERLKLRELRILQLLGLASSCATCALQSLLAWPQMALLQPVNMCLCYTLLGLPNRHVLLASLASNLVYLFGSFGQLSLRAWLTRARQAGVELASSHDEHLPDWLSLSGPNSGSNGSEMIILILLAKLAAISLLVFAYFHAIGLHLNRKSHHECRKSFLDIKSHVSAKLMMHSEDKKLTRLMESVIPKHLVGRMREDILRPNDSPNGNIFRRIYLDSYDNVSILFADIVNFTKISSNCSAQLLVETLNELFGRFDKAADRNHCLRIKILGDCYYCVSGIPDMSPEHAIRSVQMGLDMIDILSDLAQDNSCVDLSMRVGIHSGRVLCGVLGKKKWQFDVHSNDVKLANHMEQSGIPGRVHITEDTLRALCNRFEVEPANGHLKDTYIAQRNISTYFVLAPTAILKRRLSHQSQRRQSSSSHSSQSISGSQVSNLANSSTAQPEQQHQQVPTRARLATVSGASGSSTVRSLQQQQQAAAAAKLRFKLATQRIINALHFIRTIDAPFANFDELDQQAAKEASENMARVLRQTIQSQCKLQDRAISRFRLSFKDPAMGRLYRLRHSHKGLLERRWVSLRAALLLLTGLITLLLLVYLFLTPPFPQHFGFQRPNRGAMFLVMSGQLLLSFILNVIVYLHQVEHCNRRNFLWKRIAAQDKDRMTLMRNCNRFIYFNLLPPHVASYFLAQRVSGSHMDLYYKSYERIGVVFASISNFSEFYSEVQGNNHGLECLRLLNEIICDFDNILDDKRFKAVDKIKTIGSTYMAAIGLFPHSQLPAEPIEMPQTTGIEDRRNSSPVAEAELAKQVPNADEVAATRRVVGEYLETLVMFVIEMKARLQDINEHSYNNFKLRAGINIGPVTAGVIGASKPQYDIWGNTVNVASRMETTAEIGRIQVTEEVYHILTDLGSPAFNFTCRGSINVKGKGFMTTYYLDY